MEALRSTSTRFVGIACLTVCLSALVAVRSLTADVPVTAPIFQRGDANDDGDLDIADPVGAILGHLFLGQPQTLPCRDAADADDDGRVTIGDAVFLLEFLFRSGLPPEPPFPACGVDATDDDLDCESYTSCPAQITNSIGMLFAYIPPGEFLMGSPESEPGRDPEYPYAGDSPHRERQHPVVITCGYYIGVTEVTQRQWLDVMGGENPSEYNGGTHGVDLDRPVERVSWHDAVRFCETLTRRDGRHTYRLPTEAEWEHACRAGTTSAFSFGEASECELGRYDCTPSRTTISQACRERVGPYVWWCGNTRSTQPVGQLLPNPWGLYDIHGNVGEWVHDAYAPYPEEPTIDPTGPVSGRERVIRGAPLAYSAGRWPLAFGRSAARGYANPSSRTLLTVGFRVVLGEFCPRVTETPR